MATCFFTSCFYSKIGGESGDFDLTDVAGALNSKLIFRHPHVFGDTRSTFRMMLAELGQIKLRKGRLATRPCLPVCPKSLPAMIKADRIQEKAPM